METTLRKRVTTFGGLDAKTRHFLVDRTLHASAVTRVETMDAALREEAIKKASKLGPVAQDRALKRIERFSGLALSDVMRHGVEQYAASAPEVTGEVEAGLPEEGIDALRELTAFARPRNGDGWRRERGGPDAERLTHYMAALQRAGWTVQAIADALVEVGYKDKMSRQAVSLRVKKAPQTLLRDLPPVPQPGARRIVPRNETEAAHHKARQKDSLYNMSFRVADQTYAGFSERVRAEQAMVSVIMEGLLREFLSGRYDRALKDATRKRLADAMS